MAIILACGWEAGHNLVWNAHNVGGVAAVGGAHAHTGNYGIQTRGGGGRCGQWGLTLPVTPDTVYIACWIEYVVEAESDNIRWGVRLGDTLLIYFRYDRVNNTLDLYVNGVKVADGSLVVPIAAWTHFQAYIYVADAGQVMTRINGYNDINYSGDTKPGASSAITWFFVETDCVTNAEMRIDDLVIDDADWLGDVRIEGLVPNAAGDDTDWDLFPDGGEVNWEDVEELPPDDDTTYVYTGTDAQDDLYNLDDWAAGDNAPVVVVQYARAKRMSANPTAFKFLAKESGSTAVSGNQTLVAAGYKYFQRILTTKPSGGIWTDAAIDALQIGQRSVI